MSITGLLNFIHITKKVVLVNTFIEYVTNSTAGTVFTANNIEQDIISFNIFNLFYPPGTKLVVSFLIPGRERIDKEKVWTVYRYPFTCLIFFLLGITAILVVTGPLKGCGCFSRTHESPGISCLWASRECVSKGITLHSGWQPGMASSAASKGLVQDTRSLSISSAFHQELLCGYEWPCCMPSLLLLEQATTRFSAQTTPTYYLAVA